ncbi:MAG: type II secretion system protein [Candidatus Omnitrophota bacterium]|jgi:Tfp pilus assembly protein PilE
MRNKLSKGLSLVELIVAVILVGTLFITLGTGYAFIYGRITANLKLQKTLLQIDYTLENIRLHCLSASKVADGSLFPAGTTSQKSSLQFQGESNIYNITPDDLSDNLEYTYSKDSEGNLVLLSAAIPGVTSSTITIIPKEVLVDKQYAPQITFQYTQGTEPNFLSVTIDTPLTSKTEGVRFWFTEVVK